MSRLQHLFAILLLISQIYAETVQIVDTSKLTKFYYNKCLNNSGSTAAYDKLGHNMHEMLKGFQSVLPLLLKEDKAFCNIETQMNLESLMKKITDDLRPCFTQDEQFFSDFYKDTFSEFLHFWCYNNGEYIHRYLAGNPCRKNIDKSKTNIFEHCMGRLFDPIRNVSTKRELCDDSAVVRRCLIQVLDVNCPYFSDFKDLNKVFFDFIRRPCNSCVHYLISPFVLIISLIVQVLVNKF